MPGNFLASLLGSPAVDSQSQLEAARQVPTYSPEIEAHARRAGFRNAHEMMLFEKARQTGHTVERSPRTVADHAIRAYDRGDAMAWHPKNIFNYIANAMAGR